jgi:hypothetical protein
MATYDVEIWETDTLRGVYGDEPQKRLKTYLNGAFDYLSDSINVGLNIDSLQMYEDDENESNWKYEQYVRDSNTALIPCESFDKKYDGIRGYFRDYLDYCQSRLSDADVHILLTAANAKSLS